MGLHIWVEMATTKVAVVEAVASVAAAGTGFKVVQVAQVVYHC
jgi:hypothetical protein